MSSEKQILRDSILEAINQLAELDKSGTCILHIEGNATDEIATVVTRGDMNIFSYVLIHHMTVNDQFLNMILATVGNYLNFDAQAKELFLIGLRASLNNLPGVN